MRARGGRMRRERRAHHDLVPHRVVEDGPVVLVDEGVDLLVGDEHQQAVDGLVGRVEIPAAREFLHAVTHVAQELIAELLALDVAAHHAPHDPRYRRGRRNVCSSRAQQPPASPDRVHG